LHAAHLIGARQKDAGRRGVGLTNCVDAYAIDVLNKLAGTGPRVRVRVRISVTP
jgi:hypothetical protein